MKHSVANYDFKASEANEVSGLFKEFELCIESYIDEILWWNRKINLISRYVSRETLANHVLHSLTISQSKLFQKADFIIDTGTGGGLPGIPLTITWPEKQIILNDIISKKMMACKQITTSLKLRNARCEGGSIADLNWSGEALIISKHAFKINDLWDKVKLKNWKGMVLLKGSAEVEQELDGISDNLNVKIYNLDAAFKDAFFEGKALVEIKKMEK